MKKGLRLSVLLPVITGLILSVFALFNVNPLAFANGTVNWTGQGTTNGSLNTTDCSQQNYLLWVFSLGGNNSVSSATLTLGGSGSGTYPMVANPGNEMKATTPFFNLSTLTASVAYVGTLGNGNSNLVISHGCPGTNPSPTPTPRVTPSPTPTPTPKVTPTPTPSVTPTPSITPSPTPNPCDEEDDDDDYDNNHVTFWNLFRFDVQAHFDNDECPTPTPSPRPTPTPTPSATPTPNPSPSTPPIGGGGPSIGGNISTPQCPSDRPQKVDQVWFTDVKPGEVTVNWANKGDAWGFQVQYGPSQNNLIWGVEVADSKATQYTLKNLPGGDIWVQVIAKSSKECGGPGSDPKVVGQVLGGQVLAATGNSQATIAFVSGFALIVLGLWQAQRALKVSTKRN